eukprot:7942900-Alexandrium_andersonii.AAC.1
MRPGVCDRLRVSNVARPSPVAGPAYGKWGFLLHPTAGGCPPRPASSTRLCSGTRRSGRVRSSATSPRTGRRTAR